jgi:hypothetical protein
VFKKISGDTKLANARASGGRTQCAARKFCTAAIVAAGASSISQRLLLGRLNCG